MVRIMQMGEKIRNVSVIGHHKHGKSSLTDSLVAAAADIHMADTGADEAKRGITTKATGISVNYKETDAAPKALGGKQNEEYLINLIDTPGHVDFSAEVTTALRVTDGALVVVDCMDGVSLHTKSLIDGAINERVRPVLVINKVERCFLDETDGEKVYQRFKRVIEDTNERMGLYDDPVLGDLRVNPLKGTVVFSSGLDGWAFTLKSIAKWHASMRGKVKEATMLKVLWGDHYFDTTTRKWTTKSSGESCVRGFVQFCYKPIKRILKAYMDEEKEKLWPSLCLLGITLEDEEKTLMVKDLVKVIMRKWLPASAVLDMIVSELPSPQTAQKYRVEKLYRGPMNDKYADAIRNCNPNGPLMVYICKMIPTTEGNKKGNFFALGRIFAGRVSSGSKLKVMGPAYIPGQTKGVGVGILQGRAFSMRNNQDVVTEVACGNFVLLAGFDKLINKTATLTNCDEKDAYPIRAMAFSACPVVGVMVKCEVPSEQPKLNRGLEHLAKSDPIVLSAEDVIVGTGPLHVETCVNDLLNNRCMGGAKIVVSKPFVNLSETVSQSGVFTSVSPNGFNRISFKARPMGLILTHHIEDGKFAPHDDPKAHGEIPSNEVCWNKDEIWCFGPGNIGPNILICTCRGVKYLSEIKQFLVAAFQKASKEGALAGETMRGICFEICDALIHADPIQRGDTQISQTALCGFYQSQHLPGGPHQSSATDQKQG